jgi:hypothetical protein
VIDVAQVRQLPPTANEGLLHGVVSLIGVAHDQPGDDNEAIDFARR